MRIGELSRKTGVAASRIRFYEKHKVLPRPARDASGYRSYPDTMVKLLHMIANAQHLGFSLSEIRAAMSQTSPKMPSKAVMIKALRGKLESIDQHIRDTRARRREIVSIIAQIEQE